MISNPSHITVFAGHYGSGKTNHAVNFALRLSEAGYRTAVCDIDIVNPFYRTADHKRLLDEKGIRIIASLYANSNADIPALPPDINAVFDDQDLYSAIDLGGDEAGALALAGFNKRFETDYDMFLVVNVYRPLSRDVHSLVKIKNEIEAASGLRFTGIINNSNLGTETTHGDVLRSIPTAEELSKNLGIPMRYTSVMTELRAGFEASSLPCSAEFIEIYKKEDWIL